MNKEDFKVFMKYFMRCFMNSGLYNNDVKLPGDKGYKTSQPNLKHIMKENSNTKIKKTSTEVKENIVETKPENLFENSKVNYENSMQKQKNFSLDFNIENVKLGFIYSEILGEPKCKRRRRR